MPGIQDSRPNLVPLGEEGATDPEGPHLLLSLPFLLQ